MGWVIWIKKGRFYDRIKKRAVERTICMFVNVSMLLSLLFINVLSAFVKAVVILSDGLEDLRVLYKDKNT